MKPTLFLPLTLGVSATFLLISCGAIESDSRLMNREPQPVASTQVKLRRSNGYQVIAIKEVSRLEITVYAEPGTPESPGTTRTFSGVRAMELAGSFRLNAPKRSGAASAMTTGKIVIHFESRQEPVPAPKTFSILNHRALGDSEFTDVKYFPEQVMNQAWLDGLIE